MTKPKSKKDRAPKRGRPPLPASARLHARWIGATDPQFERWQKAAAAAELPFQDWVRRTLDQAAEEA